jgi:DNA-binding IclR family transcriptional regulator
MEGNLVKESIIRALSRNNGGMTISDIASELKLHRHTASRYILVLQETGQIECLEDGRAKKCVLRRGKR